MGTETIPHILVFMKSNLLYCIMMPVHLTVINITVGTLFPLGYSALKLAHTFLPNATGCNE